VGQELDNLLESAGQTATAVKDFAMADVHTSSTPFAAASVPVREGTLAQANSVAVHEPSPFVDAAKRSIGEDGALSPAKRAKTGDQGPRTAHPIPPISAVTTPTEPPATSSVLGTSDFTATSTASVVPELPEPGEAAPGDADSDDDDKISLVFGQDTDDESD
jgi:hypothetical protein